MIGLARAASILVIFLGETVVNATNYTADPTNFVSVFNGAQAGDMITLTGSFGRVTLADRSFVIPLQINASAATFSDTLLIKNVSGIDFTGGYYGSTTGGTHYNAAVAAYDDSSVSFDKAYVVGANIGTGIVVSGSTGVSVMDSTFSGLHSGVDVVGSTGAVLNHNRSINAASDGFDIANSHFVSVTNSSCTAGNPTAGSHADCVQLYSILGNPVQSDITVTDNYAHGATQGFTSFNPMDGGGLRIDISRNVVETSNPQGIACYACVDSRFTFNTVNTLPGAAHKTGISIVGGADNLVYGNTIGGAPAPQDDDPLDTEPLSDNLRTELAWTPATFLGLVTAAAPGQSVSNPPVSNVPEPGAWALMIAGFGMIGGMLRRGDRPSAA